LLDRYRWIDAPIICLPVAQDDGDRFVDLGMIGRKTEISSIQQTVVTGNTFGLVETSTPMSIFVTGLEETSAPALARDSLP